jgi:hypothetical protein
MSAQVIQFGNGKQLLPTKIRRRSRGFKKAVRLIFGEELYEVEFYGNLVERVSSVRYRTTRGGVQEMRRPRWRREYQHCDWQEPLDAALVNAARAAIVAGEPNADLPFREAALAQLHVRRAKLVREIEMIDATLASMSG